MGQLNYYINQPAPNTIHNWQISNGILSFSPITPTDSISIGTINFLYSAANGTKTLSVGLYSLNSSTLSIANSWSGTINTSVGTARYVSLSATSATQNITPGTWWLGILISTSGTAALSLYGQTSLNPQNAFPGAFIQGIMTDSTAALPASIATSDLDITGGETLYVPHIIMTA